jgi:hypothetical protein
VLFLFLVTREIERGPKHGIEPLEAGAAGRS